MLTLEDYKEHTKKSNPEDDEMLLGIVEGANQFVKTYCGRDFDRKERTEVIDIDFPNTTEIYLREIPVVSIAAVTVSEEYGTPKDITSQIKVSKEIGRIVWVETTYPKEFYQGIEAVSVTYTAGYITVPADLKLALLDLVGYYYKKQTIPRLTTANVTKENKVGSGIGHKLPSHITRILDMYKYII